ncbi:hypothetical protein WM28_08070 [Burkholderia ubonensis]|nr:hypothetical protein WM28_08070 [Burkholderia ubonensis]
MTSARQSVIGEYHGQSFFFNQMSSKMRAGEKMTITIASADWRTSWPVVNGLLERIPEWKHDQRPASNHWAARGTRDKSLLILASHDGTPVGFQAGYVTTTTHRHGYLWIAGVLPDYRNQGVMTRLFKCVGEHARDHWQVGSVELDTGTAYPDMLKLVAKIGFKQESTTPSPQDMRFRIQAQHL